MFSQDEDVKETGGRSFPRARSLARKFFPSFQLENFRTVLRERSKPLRTLPLAFMQPLLSYGDMTDINMRSHIFKNIKI